MKRGNPLGRWIIGLQRTGSPASFTLLGIAIAFFLVLWSLSGGPSFVALMENLVFMAPGGFVKPWTLVAYILFNPGPMAILGVAIGLFFFATALERSLGTRLFVTGFLAISLLTSLMAAVGALILGVEYWVLSMGIPVACVVVAWATRNPGATVLLWFVLPIKAVWIGWMAFVLTLVGFTWSMPAMALFLAVPFVVSWAYAAGKFRFKLRAGRPSRRGVKEGDYGGLDWDKRRDAEKERRRLKELFERSWRDDSDQENR